ncbi:hypothetical protein RF11_02309 [Thelohanellus kitauei]|uniref:Uncharacterized protein n=1 Tax=Thelohanellus kitauei TaxID=669202 RepID=A0A0C2N0W5_THEKT|nr:hypothetical protein RF11_02309 [Thelohanellus kitauei]
MTNFENPNIIPTHSFIHRDALVSKAMDTDLQSVLDDFDQSSSEFSKCYASKWPGHNTLLMDTEVRWISKGKGLSRFYEVRDELNAFFINQQDKQKSIAFE